MAREANFGRIDNALFEMILGRRYADGEAASTPSPPTPGPLGGFLNYFTVKGPGASVRAVDEFRGGGFPSSDFSQKQVDTSKWEEMYAVVDSGATVPVLHPKTGKAYQVEESEASRAGVEYEIADGSGMPNLGQKRMAVVTEEGTLRGYSSQCADVSESLQSVRAMLASQHAVCFGLGPEGKDHLIINKVSGEINHMIDDGTNCLQKLFIVPPEQIDAIQEKINETQHAGEDPDQGDLHRPGQ